MRKPNFFIVGAPKCGTTALATYLSKNPHVFFSNPKEPDYFVRHMWLQADHKRVPSFRNSLDHYLALFDEAQDQHLAIGEGSVAYLLSETALQEIATFQPRAKIIVMLRNPVELVHALHQEQLFHMLEDVEDFQIAWFLQEHRTKGECIPKGAEKLETLIYGKVGAIGSHLETVYKIFPFNQVHVIFFEDFVSRTRNVYLNTLKFLQIPDDGRDAFPIINPNTAIRPTWLLRRIKESHKLRLISAYLKYRFGVNSWGIVKKLQGKNMVVTARKPLSAEFHAELVSFFKPEIEKVQRLTGRNLASWLK